MIDNLCKKPQQLQRHQKIEEDSDSQQHERKLPGIVEDKMDSFHLELKQKQSEILKQAESILNQFETKFVDKRIKETAKRLTKQFLRRVLCPSKKTASSRLKQQINW